MPILEAQVSFPSNFVSILSAIKHNSSVLSNLKHYTYFGQKQPIKVQIIFQTTRQLFLKLIHDVLPSWNITHLYFFRSKVLHFARKGPITIDFWVLGSKFTKFLLFLNNKLIFLQILLQSSVSWDITPLYFFNWNFVYFQQKEPIKVQIW